MTVDASEKSLDRRKFNPLTTLYAERLKEIGFVMSGSEIVCFRHVLSSYAKYMLIFLKGCV